MVDDVVSPFGPALIILGFALAWAALLALWLAWRIGRLRGSTEPVPVRAQEKRDWLEQIDSLLRDSATSNRDLRVFHLALAHLLRQIAGERIGRDVSSWGPARLQSIPVLTGFGRLIGALEEPSFAPLSRRSDAVAAAGAARQVVLGW